MKKVVAIVLSVVVVLGVFTACGCYWYRPQTVDMMVFDLDRENDEVVCEDEQGNLWGFYGVEDWEIGDYAHITMRGNRITDAKYAGSVEYGYAW